MAMEFFSILSVNLFLFWINISGLSGRYFINRKFMGCNIHDKKILLFKTPFGCTIYTLEKLFFYSFQGILFPPEFYLMLLKCFWR